MEAAISTPVIEEEAPRVALSPNLNWDLAGLAALLFVIIAYHVQHPTLLFESQFGRSFRDESLQEACALLLGLACFALVGSWQRLRAGWSDWAGRLRWGLLGVGLALFCLHVFLYTFRDTNIFLELHNAPDAETLEDAFREDELLQPVKALNTGAVFTGVALMSALALWSPWGRVRLYRGKFAAWEPLRDVAGLAAVWLILAAHYHQNPLWSDLFGRVSLFGLPLASYNEGAATLTVGLLAVACGVLMALPNPTIRLVWAVRIALGAYVAHLLVVVFADHNILLNYYNVSPENYGALFQPLAMNSALLAFDQAAILGGLAVGAAVLLWSPWERVRVYRAVAWNNLSAIVVAILAVIGWELAIEIFKIEAFLLPRPSVIWDYLKDNYPKLISTGYFTFKNAAYGFMAGSLAGLLTGIFSARFSKFSNAILPLAIAANSIPIIAFAPIANFWFGVTSPNSKIAIVGVLCYFPIMISTVRGLTSVNQTQLELMRSYAANELDIFRKLRLPNALPMIFSALKLATTLSMIGAIVSEFFGGSLSGLGYRIREDAGLFRFPASWSAIIVASLFGISFYILISALERGLMPWYRSFRSE